MRVYISCPKTVPQDEIIKYAALMRSWGAFVTYWDRGPTYTPDNLDGADAVVVILPNKKFHMDMSDIPAGTRSEIRRCLIRPRIPLYIGYTPMSDNQPHIYCAGIATDTSMFTGIKGTADDLKEKITTRTKTVADVLSENCKYDDSWDPPKPAPAPKYAGVGNHAADCFRALMNTDPLFNPEGKIIYGTPGGYDRRLLLLLR